MKHNRNKNALVLHDYEMQQLLKFGVVEIERKGFIIIVELKGVNEFNINIVNPYETVVSKSNFY